MCSGLVAKLALPVFACCVLQAAAQQLRYKIIVGEEHTISGLQGQIFTTGPIKCSHDSRVAFFRQAMRPGAFQAPIVAVDVHDATYKNIDFASASAAHDLRNFIFADFAVLGSEVIVLGHHNREATVLYFSNDGSFKTAAKLEHPMEPYRFVVFSSGNLLVSGLVYSEVNPKDFKAVSELYDSSGKFLRHVGLHSANITVKTADDITKLQDTQRSIGLAVSTTDDDTAYIIPYTAGDATLYAIRSSGQVERTLKLSRPSPEDRARNLRVLGAQLFVEYDRTDPKTHNRVSDYMLYDSQSGEARAVYDEPPEYPGSFACFDWQRTMTYIGLNHGMRTVVYGDIVPY